MMNKKEKKRWKMGWKLVTVQSVNGRISYRSWLYGWAYRMVKYGYDFVTTPNAGCGPLCVFPTHEAAINFIQFLGCKSDLIRCAYVPSKKKTVWGEPGEHHKKPMIKHHKKPMIILPRGTVLADEVILVKEVQSGKSL